MAVNPEGTGIYTPIATAETETESANRDAYDALMTQVAANPGGYRPQELASLIGTQWGDEITYQEYVRTLETIYGLGDTWDTNYPVAAPTTTGPTAEELAALNATHKKNVSDINQAYQDGLIDWGTKNSSLEDMRNNLITQREGGLESNSAYFSNVSPDAYQSQQGNYNQKVLDSYTQGGKTVDNNQAAIDYYKQQTENNYNSGLNYENTFDEGTGKYDPTQYVAPGVVNAPTINAVTSNPMDAAAKLGVPSWAPNYAGGMSVQQAAKKKEDEAINQYLG